MSITKKLFGIYSGGEVYEYTLDNGNKLSASIITLGGTVRSLVFNGVDVALGKEGMEGYANNIANYGVIVGRSSNRIANAEFSLDGITYKLDANQNGNNLHGGYNGFAKKIWDVRECDSEEPTLVLELKSPDGDCGFPGNADVKVTYTLTKDNALMIHYEAVADADTIVNMTNHTYFNLNGHASGSVDNHKLQIESDFYTPNYESSLPTGEILSVSGTPFDFTKPKSIGEGLSSDHPQITAFGRYDHNFVLRGFGYRRAATLIGDKSAILMEMYTDRPGVQVYTPKSASKGNDYKDGVTYEPYGGVCLETQCFPDSIHFSHFPDSVLKKGEKYDTTTTYKFIQE